MYLKVTIENTPYEIEIDDRKIFAKCRSCQDEIKVDAATMREMILLGATFKGTQITCNTCS